MSGWGFVHEKLDIKFLILYVMARVTEPVPFEDVLELSMCDDGFGYFDLSDCLAELVSTEHVLLQDGLYTITEKGERNSAICESSLPFSVRMHCDELMVNMNQLLRQEAQIRCAVEPNADGTHTLHLCLNDVNTPLLKLELLVPSTEQADVMIRNFKSDPAGLYLHLTHLLMKQEDKHA